MSNSKFNPGLLIGAAVCALIVESAEPPFARPHSSLSLQPTWRTASIEGPWAPHGADQEYSAVSVYGSAVMLVSGTINAGVAAISGMSETRFVPV